MDALFTKEQAREYLRLGTTEAAERLLARLGVRKLNYGIVGGKGIRYRRADIEEALVRIEVGGGKPKPRKKAPKPDLFDLPVKEQMALLTAFGPKQ